MIQSAKKSNAILKNNITEKRKWNRTEHWSRPFTPLYSTIHPQPKLKANIILPILPNFHFLNNSILRCRVGLVDSFSSTDHQEEQDMEIEAMQAVFMDDFERWFYVSLFTRLVISDHPGTFKIKLVPELGGTNYGALFSPFYHHSWRVDGDSVHSRLSGWAAEHLLCRCDQYSRRWYYLAYTNGLRTLITLHRHLGSSYRIRGHGNGL